jgi:hypothetical protein
MTAYQHEKHMSEENVERAAPPQGSNTGSIPDWQRDNSFEAALARARANLDLNALIREGSASPAHQDIVSYWNSQVVPSRNQALNNSRTDLLKALSNLQIDYTGKVNALMTAINQIDIALGRVKPTP